MTTRLRPQIRKLRAVLARVSLGGLKFAFGVSAALASVYFVLVVVLPFVRGHEYFRLRSVRVTCDHRSVAPQSLAAVAGLWNGTTIWEVDAAKAEDALEDIPWVRNATVTRRFPWHVSVHVQRRHPVVATLAGDGVFLVDDTGAVFRDPGKVVPPDLVYVRGWDDAPRRGERMSRLRRLIELARAASNADHAVSELAIDEEGIFWLYPEEPRIAVALGQDPDPALVVSRFGEALARLGDNLGLAREIDLGWDDQVVVRTKGVTTRRVLAARLMEESSPAPTREVEDSGRG